MTDPPRPRLLIGSRARRGCTACPCTRIPACIHINISIIIIIIIVIGIMHAYIKTHIEAL